MAQATSGEMTLLLSASISATLAVFYWRSGNAAWQKAVVPESWADERDDEEEEAR